MQGRNIDELFPFGSYREKQRAVLKEAKRMLQSDEYDNVIIDAPTGVGKSAINVALCRDAEDAFYTTPQKKLREQLDDDQDLNDHYKSLRGRRDYTCGVTGDDCESCDVYQDAQFNCSQRDDCTYMNHKHIAVDHDTAAITFAYLIVDGKLPPEAGFGDRELLVVDECHNLVNQVASLHMGFEVTPYNLPDEVFGNVTDDLFMNATYYTAVEDVVNILYDRAETFIVKHENHDGLENQVEQCEEFVDHAGRFFEDTQKEEESSKFNPWVINTDMTSYGGELVKTFTLKPIDVSHFLNKHVWSRADKKVLSTATMPYRDNPDRWCAELGINAERTGIIHVRMPFPARNRPVYTGRMVADMTGGGDDENWEAIMDTLNELQREHSGQKGLVHTASYERAERVAESAQSGRWKGLEDNLMVHQSDSDADFVDQWYESDKDICLSPSMSEGVDLYDDRCRWQALLKVPYPSPADSRVEYLLEERPEIGWSWYNNLTSCRVIQSAGRAVRSKSDYANYYVLDEAFNKIRRKASFPDWFENAIVDEEGRANTALDW